MSRTVLTQSVLVLLAGTSAATAQPITHKASRFSIDPAVPGYTVCVVIPPGGQWDEACPSERRQPDNVNPGLIGTFLLISDQAPVATSGEPDTFIVALAREESSVIVRADLNDFIRGVADGAAAKWSWSIRRTPDDQLFEVLRVKKTRMARFIFESETGELTSVGLVIPTHGASVLIQIINASGAPEEETLNVARALGERIDANPTGLATRHFGQDVTREFFAGAATFDFLVRAMWCFALAASPVSVGLFLYFRFRRRRAPPRHGAS